MATHYEFTRWKNIVAQQEEYISIPANAEEFIRSIPADIWQAAQKNDMAAIAKVWDLAVEAGYDEEYVDRFYVDDTNEPAYYEYAEWSN